MNTMNYRTPYPISGKLETVLHEYVTGHSAITQGLWVATQFLEGQAPWNRSRKRALREALIAYTGDEELNL